MLTYNQQPNHNQRMKMYQHQPIDNGLIDGYALVMGNQDDITRQLTALLWEHGVPAYAAPSMTEPDNTVAARGTPAFILLHMEKVDASAIVDLETFRMRYDVPLLCVAPADARQPHVQALLQMATDFIVTPYQSQELILRIRRVCSAARVSRKGQPVGERYTSVKRTAPLTDTERKILKCLGDSLGEPVHLDELAALIPGDTPQARVKLLRVHIFRLRQKIEPMPKNPTYVRTMRDYGYYLSEQPEGIEA
jgi:two-component system response regulator VicR